MASCLSLLQFLKFVNFRQHYSIEFAMWFIFAIGPYFLAEGLKLSGVWATQYYPLWETCFLLLFYAHTHAHTHTHTHTQVS